jgi:hypothetical protein
MKKYLLPLIILIVGLGYITYIEKQKKPQDTEPAKTIPIGQPRNGTQINTPIGSDASSTPIEWGPLTETYTNTRYGYRIKYPKGSYGPIYRDEEAGGERVGPEINNAYEIVPCPLAYTVEEVERCGAIRHTITVWPAYTYPSMDPKEILAVNEFNKKTTKEIANESNSIEFASSSESLRIPQKIQFGSTTGYMILGSSSPVYRQHDMYTYITETTRGIKISFVTYASSTISQEVMKTLEFF